jgi:hypothetical protein
MGGADGIKGIVSKSRFLVYCGCGYFSIDYGIAFACANSAIPKGGIKWC